MKKPLKGGFFAAPISTTAKEYLVKNILEQQKSLAHKEQWSKLTAPMGRRRPYTQLLWSHGIFVNLVVEISPHTNLILDKYNVPESRLLQNYCFFEDYYPKKGGKPKNGLHSSRFP